MPGAGIIILYLSSNNTLILPVLLRLEAAGGFGVNFFWIMTTIILGGFLGALIGLGFNNMQTMEGDKMVIVYCNSTEKEEAISIIERYDGIIL